MLAIRLKRTGRTGHAQFRLVAQDKRFSPFSGRIVEYLGSYDPHSKAAKLDSEKIAAHLQNGAQPSARVIKLLEKEGIKLPAWVQKPEAKKKAIRNPEKLRKNRPAGAKSETKTPAKTEVESATDQPAEPTETTPEVSASTDEKTAEPETSAAVDITEAKKTETKPEPKTQPATEDEPKAEA